MSKELVNIGFSTPRYEIPLNLILQNNEYLNADGIFDPEWRSGDSIWSLVSKKILSKVLEKVSILKENGEFEDFIKKHDKKRLTSGQITFTITRKNDNENK